MVELTIKVSDEETTLVQKHLIYEDGFAVSHDDKVLSSYVAKAKEAFGDGAQEIIVKLRYSW